MRFDLFVSDPHLIRSLETSRIDVKSEKGSFSMVHNKTPSDVNGSADWHDGVLPLENEIPNKKDRSHHKDDSGQCIKVDIYLFLAAVSYQTEAMG